MPAKGDSSVLILIRPMGQVNIRDRIYIVPCNDSSSLDVLKSFVTWNNIVLDSASSSSATLYAVNQIGKRILTGGAFVQLTSVVNTPLVLAQSVTDNLDGSYGLKFAMPPGITSANVAQLTVSTNRQTLLSSPYRFPLQPSPMASAIASGAGLGGAVIGLLQIFTIQCLDANGQLTSAGFQSAAAYVLQAWTDTPNWTACTVTSVNNGLLTLTLWKIQHSHFRQL